METFINPDNGKEYLTTKQASDLYNRKPIVFRKIVARIKSGNIQADPATILEHSRPQGKTFLIMKDFLEDRYVKNPRPNMKSTGEDVQLYKILTETVDMLKNELNQKNDQIKNLQTLLAMQSNRDPSMLDEPKKGFFKRIFGK